MSEDIVHSEVVVLEECFRYVNDLVEQKWRSCLGRGPSRVAAPVDGRMMSPKPVCSRPSCHATKHISPASHTPPDTVQREGRKAQLPPGPHAPCRVAALLGLLPGSTWQSWGPMVTTGVPG